MQKLLLLGLMVCSINAFAQSTFITGFSQGLHEGGNTIETDVSFPEDVSGFSSILMNVSLDCPVGGCDPWDRFATLKVKVGNEEIEIGRYITPYGNDWCDWTIDVTEYSNLLTGDQTLTSHIETWQNGWLVNTEFEFVPGTPDYEFVHVQNLWVDYGFTYGDTLFYSIDLEEQEVMIPANAQEVVMRIVNTGHGQGNTDNAAEFSQRTHEIHVDGNQEFTQFLWKSDCDQNPCSPQGGTWQFNRAGWCPGEGVTPDDYDITNLVTAGSMARLDYELEPFFNLCSPWNPSCDEPATCNECTYNNQTHTEPHYKIVGQLIMKSDTPLEIVGLKDVLVSDNSRIYPNPGSGVVNFQMFESRDYALTITDLQGRIIEKDNFNGRFHQIDLSAEGPGVYFANVQSAERNYTYKIIIEH